MRTRRPPAARRSARARPHRGRPLLSAVDQARYDLITGEPPPPIIAGVVDLYTTEYFQLVRDRLNEGGIASYWLPVMNISAATAKSVIARLLRRVPGLLALARLGAQLHAGGHAQRERRSRSARSASRRQWDDPRARPNCTALGFELPEQLGALFIGDADYLRALDRGRAAARRRPTAPHAAARHARRARCADLAVARPAADRGRFLESDFVASLRRADIRRSAAAVREPAVIDDLLFPEPTEVRQTQRAARCCTPRS